MAGEDADLAVDAPSAGMLAISATVLAAYETLLPVLGGGEQRTILLLRHVFGLALRRSTDVPRRCSPWATTPAGSASSRTTIPWPSSPTPWSAGSAEDGGVIFHLAYERDWDEAKRAGDYRLSTRGRTLEQQGFIHCSATPGQVEQVANSFYTGERGLVVLLIAEDRVRAEVHHDPVPGFDTPLPHIYGPLNPDAVIATHPLEAGPDGRFTFAPGGTLP